MKRFSMSTNNISQLTKQQQIVVDSNDTTVLVNAVAGSGKTSTLMYLSEKYEKGIYLAFNKAIVGEVIPKLPVGWTCKTFNAFGLSLVKQHYPTSRVNFQKYDKYMQWGGQTCSILASKHMNMNGNIAYTSWKDTCDRFQIGYQFIDDAQELLKQGKADTNQISADDMLQYPIDNGWKSKQYDIVLVDECQDLNPQQIAFLGCIPTKRIVFVGDINQAIYGFRGSDPYAIDKIKETYNPVEYELTESFRCPLEILSTIKHIVPNIFSRKKDGIVHQSPLVTNIDYPDECFIISRTNNHLIKLAYQFIQEGKHFSIGGTFIAQLKRDLNKAFKGCTTLIDMRNNVKYNYNKELSRAAGNRWSTNTIENKYESLLSIVNMASKPEDIDTFVKNLGMHSDSASCRKLMTIHAAKGLESLTVFFIKPDTCAYFKEKSRVEWEKQQEDNLYYVACTRALNTLVFLQ